MSLADIAWMAGLLEGEGSFGLQKASTYKGKISRTARISLGMTDEDVVGRAARIMRVPIYGPYGPYTRQGRLPTWHLRAHGPTAASWMMMLYPLMGERRRSQIRKALAHWKTLRPYDARRKRANSPG